MLKKANHQSRPPVAATTPAQVPLMPTDLTQSLLSGMDFVKTFWGSLPESVPGFVVPTVDVDELDKRITDLRAVEAWLAVNSNLLRTTIQSLEVQRNTIAAIQSFGGNLGGLTQDLLEGKNGPAHPAAAPPTRTRVAAEGSKASRAGPDRAAPENFAHKVQATDPQAIFGRSGAAWLGLLEDQFARVVSSALASGMSASASSKPRPRAAPASPSNPKRAGAKRATAKSKRSAT